MAEPSQYYRLRLILGDQLNAAHSWFQQTDQDTLYVIAELHQEAGYTKHHIQKLCAFFAAMEAFAQKLAREGHCVLHLTLDDTRDYESLPDLLAKLVERYGVCELEYQQPDEYRLAEQLAAMELGKNVRVLRCCSEHFLVPFDEIGRHFKPGKSHQMESFYRQMRKRHKVLMDGDRPQSGRWNFDKENRNKIKASDVSTIPQPLMFSNDVADILERIDRHGIDHFGEPNTALLWPVNHAQAQQLLEFFCSYLLANFGRYQDAMTCQSPHQWSLYHSRLSFALNTKMLDPKTVIDTAVTTFENSNGHIDLAQLEGFVRQILGWREFVRGVYWANMPDYRQQNFFSAKRPMPSYFWTGKTRMRCMHETITQSLGFAYAHHIQRLMVTGNFCLLFGIYPDEVDEWYLGVYVDAIEWVELPNTRGMSQFADGGLLGTKPYAASANYMSKMSDYCSNCAYDSKAKTGKDACPFNSLYWHFLDRNRPQLHNNRRMSLIYKNWDRQDEQDKKAVLKRARECLNNMEDL